MTKIMVFAAHPDDEVIGCGGIIQRNGKETYVVYLTNGTTNKHQIRRNQEKSLSRKGEAVKAMSLAGLKPGRVKIMENTYYFALDETKLQKTEENIRKHLEKVKPDVAYVPSYEGGHFDHDVTNYLVNKVAKKLKKIPAIYEYPLYNNHPLHLLNKLMRRAAVYLNFNGPAPKFIPNKGSRYYIINMSKKELDKKEEMLKAYGSQNKNNLLVRLHSHKDRIRVCPNYDYSKKPHRFFPLNYELTTKLRFEDFIKAIR